MRILFALLVVFGLVAAKKKATVPVLPRLIAIQIDRCPAELYTDVSSIEDDRMELDEAIRFKPNENGTLSFFVAGEGAILMDINADKDVFAGLDASLENVENRGGWVATQPFQVLKSVSNTAFNITLSLKNRKRFGSRTITVHAVTKNLEPPRPPSRQSAENGKNDEAEVKTVNFPSINAVLHGNYSKANSETLSLDSITFNLDSSNKTEKFMSQTNQYDLTVGENEKGMIVFNVNGDGPKTVSVKSLDVKSDQAKVLNVKKGSAAFKYTADESKVKLERFMVKIENTKTKEAYYYYIRMRRGAI